MAEDHGPDLDSELSSFESDSEMAAPDPESSTTETSEKRSDLYYIDDATNGLHVFRVNKTLYRVGVALCLFICYIEISLGAPIFARARLDCVPRHVYHATWK